MFLSPARPHRVSAFRDPIGAFNWENAEIAVWTPDDL